MRAPASLARPLGRRWALGVFALLLTAGSSARSAEDEPSGPRGRPEVTLDRLVFSKEAEGSRELERHLRNTLRREARRADWGAGSGAKIEYRFTVEELSVSVHGNVLRIRCTAFGRLPKGKTARSFLEYGGNPSRRVQEIKKVLDIVARGVLTRLAEQERQRRLGR